MNPRGTSQRCSGCNQITKKKLSERIHKCNSCGLVLGRDHNAAININSLGWSEVTRLRLKDLKLAEIK